MGIFKSTSFDVPIISVGNLAVGGSGKTPMVEYLIRELQNVYTIATLSRGYGRKTKGFRWVEANDSYTQTGDEPLQIKTKFASIAVAVCEDRIAGVQRILKDKPKTNLILLDDAFQHRAIKPRVQLVLSTYTHPFLTDWMMPSGRLRERRSGARRADAIVFTKTPNAGSSYAEATQYGIPVFYTTLSTELLTQNQDSQTTIIYGFSGLAVNSGFENHLKESYNLVGFSGYRDHYAYTQNDIDDIRKAAKGARIVCTEKDWIKIKDLKNTQDITPIRVRISNEHDLINWIKAKLNES